MKSSVRQKSKIMADRHKILECSICRKTMRSNNLKRHWRTKHKIFDMEIQKTGRDIFGKPGKCEFLVYQLFNNGNVTGLKV